MGDLLMLLFLQNFLNPPVSACAGTSKIAGSDPLLQFQWHLKNEGNFGGTTNSDSNVQPAWDSGTTGKNIKILIVDDGVDICHEDLNNTGAEQFNVDFTNRLSNQINGTTSCDNGNACHGTAVAGVAGAVRNNSVGGAGTAPDALVAGRNLLLSSNDSFSANIVTSMSKDISGIDISNNSWGAPDTTGKYNAGLAFSGWRDAIQEGVTAGRGGKGALYFWAGGNGGRLFSSPQTVLSTFNDGLIWVDNSNYDGQANDPRVMAVCAIGNRGQQVFYSERGANLLVCGYSEGDNRVATTTTDIMGSAGYNPNSSRTPFSTVYTNNYTNIFNGTSSATPNVAGVAALMLEANPNLTWRDVRWILAKTAKKTDPDDDDWDRNNAAEKFDINHKYGFGAVDANAAVSLAKSQTLLGAEVTPLNGTGGSLSITTRAEGDAFNTAEDESTISLGTGIGKIESVEVTVSFNASSNLGDLDLRLISPGNTESRLSEPHPCLGDGSGTFNQVPCNTGAVTWTFSTLRNMDEPANGTWRLRVVDRRTAPIMIPGSYTSGSSTITVTNSANHNNPDAAITSWSIRVRGRAN
ncbi:MAG: S8 family serine peptidase [Leptospira sp.]|nr:S8 family serine peptidase [Leptospira sp.]